MTGVRDYSTGELKHNVVALAKAGKALTTAKGDYLDPRPHTARSKFKSTCEFSAGESVGLINCHSLVRRIGHPDSSNLNIAGHWIRSDGGRLGPLT